MAAKVAGGSGVGARGRKLGGRKKGTPNKLTASVKEAFSLAFQGIGGVPSLISWANDNQTEFYKLYARLIPTEVVGKDGGPIQGHLEVRFVSE